MYSFVRRAVHRVESGQSQNLVQPWRVRRGFEGHYIGKLSTRLELDYAWMLREYSGYQGQISFEPTPERFRARQQNSHHVPHRHVRGIELQREVVAGSHGACPHL